MTEITELYKRKRNVTSSKRKHKLNGKRPATSPLSGYTDQMVAQHSMTPQTREHRHSHMLTPGFVQLQTADVSRGTQKSQQELTLRQKIGSVLARSWKLTTGL